MTAVTFLQGGMVISGSLPLISDINVSTHTRVVQFPGWVVSFPVWTVPFPVWMVPFPVWMVPFPVWMVPFPVWMVPFPNLPT